MEIMSGTNRNDKYFLKICLCFLTNIPFSNIYVLHYTTMSAYKRYNELF
jgi:hypothetical protein